MKFMQLTAFALGLGVRRVSYGGNGPHDSTFTMFLEEKDGVQRAGMDAADDLNTTTDE